MAKKVSGKNQIITGKIMATRSIIPFPGVPVPYSVESDDQFSTLQRAMENEETIVTVPVKNPKESSSNENLAPVGVVGKVLKVLDLPDGSRNAFIVCENRVEIFPDQQLNACTYLGSYKDKTEKLTSRQQPKFAMLMELIVEAYDYIREYFQEVSNVQMAPPKELQDNLLLYLNFIIVTSPFSYEDRLEMLLASDMYRRAEMVMAAMEKVKQHIEFRKEIFNKASSELEREQRDHFLRAQIRTIQNEMGEGEENEINALMERGARINWNDDMKALFSKEVAKLRRFNPTTPDYALQFTYIDTLLNLPWDNIAEEEIDLERLESDLEREHYGMKKIKERIMEHIAVLKLRGDMRSPILCLYGPPGVGKTSLCKSIADSIRRDYSRISLGGLHDETQLRGHRRTYIGALPGRIITALSKLKTNNPVFVLDEIDKIGNDHRGDPAQALLEILDPEQNHKFHDNYLDVDYDLSKIFFIATANNLSTISAPLLDRMELIEISGYLLEEKVEIAKRHLIPKLIESHGFKKNEIKFSDEAIKLMIESYTRESGVRKLEKTIAAVLRKVAVKKARNQKFKKSIGPKDIRELLGKEDLIPEQYEADLPEGVVAGLAWTPVGGEILYFESSLSKGKGQITLTGNLGDVMKESATIALQWVRANAEKLGIEPERFSSTDVHLHVPEGAVPKDGPSAGITMVCSIVSSFTGRRMREKTAMTGETTLRGKVLPVGGVKEKILAAKRAGITDIILSAKNRRDIDAIEAEYLDGMHFHYVDTLDEVIEIALPTPGV